VAPLGEETENPKRNLPLAIIGSTILVALFYMFVNWGVLIGEGTANVNNFTSAEHFFDLGRRLWGDAWIIILIAAVNSALAVCIAIQNATTRVLFDMGRVRALPAFLGEVHPRWKTPWNAIWLLCGVTLAIGLGLGSWLGPVKTFGMIGIMQTLGLIIVYSMGNIGAMLFYGREA
jgi:amino acid transporter